VDARALVAPYTAANSGENVNNFTANGRAKTDLLLVVIPADGRPPEARDQQNVTAYVPNWVRVVLYHAGSNYGPRDQLPAEIDIPVRVDPASGRIVEVDVDRTATELAAYRDVAVKWWKETEAPLAELRGAIALPGLAVRGAKDFAKTWRGALSNLREDRSGAPPQASHTPEEVEQSRRTANVLKYQLARKPKQLAKVRASALTAGPMMVANVRGGSMSMADFETWLQFQSTSGAISAEEAEEWRRSAQT
jgi:hypothetical protein